ncbi:hypothetical protein [Streptomyces sp. NPDC002952]|uniref:hypothetical protein n=1 Tax=Streptomyces sp. NPDC002952 TaxID=3364673 RepID=UPI00369766CC
MSQPTARRAGDDRARAHLKALIEELKRQATGAPEPAHMFLSGMLSGLSASVEILNGGTAEGSLEKMEQRLVTAIGQAYLDGKLPAQPSPTGDEDEQRTARRDNISVLLECFTAPGRGGLTSPEADALRRHVEAEICAADSARAEVGRLHVVLDENARRHRSTITRVDELLATVQRVREIATRLEEFAENALRTSDRFLYAAIASDLRTRIDGAEQAEDLLSVAHETSNQSETERAAAVAELTRSENARDHLRQRAKQAEAAIERVRAIKRAPQRSPSNTLANAQDNGWDAALHAVAEALDGTEPIAPDAPVCDAYQPPANSDDSGYCARCGMRDVKHTPLDGMEQIGPAATEATQPATDTLRDQIGRALDDADYRSAFDGASLADFVIPTIEAHCRFLYQTSRDAEQRLAAAQSRVRVLEQLRQNDLSSYTTAAARVQELATVLNEVLRHFVHKGHPGEPCLQTGWISEKTVTRWRTALISAAQPTTEGPK